MSNSKSVTINGVRVDRRAAELMHSKGLAIVDGTGALTSREYPWVVTVGPVRVLVAPVHIWVWDHLRGHVRPRRDGEHVHHINENKADARLCNLGIGSAADHARAHAQKRQRFTLRRRWNLDGFFRPHPPSAVQEVEGAALEELRDRIADRDKAEGEARNRLGTPVLAGGTSGQAGRSQQVVNDLSNADERLAQLLPALREELDHLDSGQRIPPPASRPRRSDRLLKIERIRRGCTPGEAAFVRLLVKYAFDLDAVGAASGVPRHLVDALLRTPSVDLAIAHWRQYRRLPKPSPVQKLNEYLRGLGPR